MSNINLGTINGSGDGKELLLAAINRKTGRDYTLRDFEFGEPEAVTDVPTPTHNTSIKFGPKLDSGYYGVRTVYYNRIHASELGGIIVPYDGETRLIQLLGKINEKYGILITADDVEDTLVQGVVGSQVGVTLEFKPSSLIFYSSTQIQLGTNDPTGDTSLIMPFDPTMVLFFDNGSSTSGVTTSLLSNEPYKLSSMFTRTLSNDATRFRDTLLSESFNTPQRDGTYLDRLNIEWSGKDLVLKKHALIAGTWYDSSANALSMMTRYGDVYKLKNDASSWQFVENVFDIVNSSISDFTTYAKRSCIRALAQGQNDDVYIVASRPGEEWKLLKKESGGFWQEIDVTGKSAGVLLTSTDQERLFVSDAIVSDGKLWTLITSDHIYSAAPQVMRSPSVEIIDLATGVFTRHVLTNITIAGSVITNTNDLNYNSNSYKFVTPPDGYPHVDVMAVGQSKVSGNIFAVAWRYSSVSGYDAEILPITNSDEFAGFTGGLPLEKIDIAAEQVALSATKANLVKDSGNEPSLNHYLEVVYINCLVPSEGVSQHFLNDRVKSSEGFYKYGVMAASAVTTRAFRSVWSYKNIALSGEALPHFNICSGSKRTIGIYQSDYAWLRIGASQSQEYLKETFDLKPSLILSSGMMEGNTELVQLGVSKPMAFSISERTDVTYNLRSLDTVTNAKQVAYSFIAKEGTAIKWFYNHSETISTLLPKRVSSTPLAVFGTTPALVAARGDDVLVVSSQGYGSFVSSDRGVSWKEGTGCGCNYDGSNLPDNTIAGRHQLKLNYTNFNEASLFNDFLVAELKWNAPLKVFDVSQSSVNHEVVLEDNILLRTGGLLDKNFESGKLYNGKFNLLSRSSPRKVIAWDSDPNGIVEALGYHDEDRAGLELPERIDYYMFGIKGNLLDFSRDVKYLNVNHWLLVVQDGVYKLHFTDAVAPTKTIELFGGTGIFSNFKPEVSFHLWDYIDDAVSYCPYVFYGAKKVLLLERLKQDSTFDVSQHNLSIPGDNGNELKPVRMYTANRRDYFFTQKGNGIFKILYTWDYQTETSTVTLQKVIDLSTSALMNIEPVSGCFTGTDVRSLPMEGLIPDMLPHGTYLGWYCDGFDKVTRYADGNNGYYEERLQSSKECGFIEVGLNQGIINNETF